MTPKRPVYLVKWKGVVHVMPLEAVEIGLRYPRSKYYPPLSMTVCHVVVTIDELEVNGLISCLVCLLWLDEREKKEKR